MKDHFYLAIEGPIGVGKTTLARLVRQQLGCELVLEVFEENPFLSRFYADRNHYAFQTQIFFLLSRYRQQQSLASTLRVNSSVVSDYIFAKDRLFAHLNLAGDELDMYERVHSALAENIQVHDLVIYLRAETDVLMQRIAERDRPYEREMSHEYIEGLQVAYARFFASYRETPLLVVDTEHLDFAHHADAQQAILGRIRASIEEGAYQPPLPWLANGVSRP